MERIILNKFCMLGSLSYNAIIEYDDSNLVKVSFNNYEGLVKEYVTDESTGAKFKEAINIALSKSFECDYETDCYITDMPVIKMCLLDDKYRMEYYEIDQINKPIEAYDDLITALKIIGIESEE